MSRTWLSEDTNSANSVAQRATSPSLVAIDLRLYNTINGIVRSVTADRHVSRRATNATRFAVMCMT